MFKVGDVVEITESSASTGMLDLWVGKAYEVIGASSTGSTIRVVNESGRTDWYHCTHFRLKEDTKVEKKECLFKEGQVVWDVVYGKGVVVEIIEHSTYPVVARFSDETMAYTVDGKTYETHGRTLFFSEPKIEAATEPLFEPVLEAGMTLAAVNKQSSCFYVIVVSEETEEVVKSVHRLVFEKEKYDFYRLGEKITFK